MDISFRVDRDEFDVISDIAERAVRMARRARVSYGLIEARMDITAVHANGTPLRLCALRDADDFNFAHDVFGIRRHLDRRTGKLADCFVPRFTLRFSSGSVTP